MSIPISNQDYSSMTAEQQFADQVLFKDRQQNKRLSQRNEPGSRRSVQTKTDLYQQEFTSKNSVGHEGCFGPMKDKMRFVVILLGLLAIVLNQMSRVVLNITLPMMTYPRNSNATGSPDACPMPDLEPDSSDTTPIDNHGDRFNWTPEEQDKLLGAFFYTYSAFQIPGGVLAERFGSKYIIGASVGVSGLVNLVTPWLAYHEHSITLLFWSRLLVGLVQASLLPAIYALIIQWITGTEGMVIAAMLKMAFRLGALMGSVIPGLVSGWEISYYITGIVCVIWTILWLFMATSKPQDNNCVSLNELYRIARKKANRDVILASVDNREGRSSANNQDKETTNYGPTQKIPKFQANRDSSAQSSQADIDKNKVSVIQKWRIILTSRSVIGFVLCRLTVNFTTDFLTSIMPTYIRDNYHGDKGKISLINSLSATAQVIVAFPISWLVNFCNLNKPFGLEATGMRRVFTSLTCFGSALFLGLLTVVKCDILYSTIMIQFLAVTNMFAGGGEALIPYDLSDEYPASIAALGNSISSMSGFLVAQLKTFMIGDQTDSVSAWNKYILAIAASNITGGFIFIFNVKAKKLNFTKEPIAEEDLETSNGNAMHQDTNAISTKNNLTTKEEPNKTNKQNGKVPSINGVSNGLQSNGKIATITR